MEREKQKEKEAGEREEQKREKGVESPSSLAEFSFHNPLVSA